MVFGHFWPGSYENTKKLRKLCLHFAIQDGQDEKKGKKIMQSVTKNQKMKIWDEQNKNSDILRRLQQFDPSSTCNMTMLSNAKKMGGGPNCCGLLKISEL